MGDGTKKINIISDYFKDSTLLQNSHQQPNSPALVCGADTHQLESASALDSCQRKASSPSHSSSDSSYRKLRSVGFMLKLFSLRGLSFTATEGEEKVELTAAELGSLRSEITDLEEREAHFKAQLEHLDEILRWARLSGYLNVRTRWTALPGEPPAVDDCEVDDWIPRFIVLQGPCIFLYHSSTDLSPQDSTLLADIVEIGPLSNIVREDEETRYCFYILTRYGLRYECSSISKVQVDSWLTALGADCKLEANKTLTIE